MSIRSLVPLLAFLAACPPSPDETDPDDDDVVDEATACPTGVDAASGMTEETLDETVGTTIVFTDDGATVDGPGAQADGSVVTVTTAGAFRLSGAHADGRVVVEAADDDVVVLVLDGLDLTSADGPAISVVEADDVVLFLAEGATNHLADGATYADTSDEAPNAAVFSRSDLVIRGPGSLTVDGRFGDGVATKDGLEVENGLVTITAVDDALRGKDSVEIRGGGLALTAGGDGITSDDEGLGFVTIEGGAITVDAGGDAIVAEAALRVRAGDLWLVAGGGSTESVSSTASAKGLKAGGALSIEGGAVAIDAAEDALHSDVDVVFSGGFVCAAAGDDGLHAEGAVTFDGGALSISAAYEGVEGTLITVNDGTVRVVSEDDGFNVAGGDGSGGGGGPGGGGGSNPDYVLTINGGRVVVDADGDGLDSNGSIEINGGTALVHGPTANNNGPMDYGEGNGTFFAVNGGLLVAAGSSGMSVAPDADSAQYSVLVNLDDAVTDALFHLQSADGDGVATFLPAKRYQSVLVSSPDLGPGSFEVYVGGTVDGDGVDGWYDGAWSGGALIESFSISGKSTTVGESGGFGPP